MLKVYLMPSFGNMIDDSLYRGKWGSLEGVNTTPNMTSVLTRKENLDKDITERKVYAKTSQEATEESSLAYMWISIFLASRCLRQCISVAEDTNRNHFRTAFLAEQSGGHIWENLRACGRLLSATGSSLGRFPDSISVRCAPGADLRSLLFS